MKIKIAIIFFSVFSSLIGVAQYKNTKLKMAEGLLEEGKIYTALKIYEDVVKKDQENKYVINKITELQEQLFNYSEAAKWYYKLMEIDNGEFPKTEFKFANLMKMQGKYDLAIKHYTSFNKTYKGIDKAVLSKICKTEIKSCKMAIKAIPNKDYSIKKLSTLINSSYTDIAPFGKNGNIYYSSIPTDTAFTYKEFLDSAPSFQIYVAKQLKNDNFDTAKLFIPNVLNIPFKHTANGAFNKKGNKFFFTRCKENLKGKMICKIYCTVKKNNIWQEALSLNNLINDDDNNFTSTHPSIMSFKKGNRNKKEIEVLIYASNKPGGYGGYDLWSSIISENLDCAKPINLGKNVNSPLNEVTPFYDSKNKFFFSSNGRGGFGGFDVFEASVRKGKIKKSKVMEQPINSSWDDWYYNKMSNNSAFLSSNRSNSRSYHNEIRLDDIYYITKQNKKYLKLNANFKDSLKNLINGVVFKVKIIGALEAQWKEVSANIPFRIIPNKSYEIIVKKNGFINQRTIFSTSSNSKSDTLYREFSMFKIEAEKEIILDNIYFNSNSSILNPESKAALNRLFQTLIINPSFIVEIGAHTDNQGNIKSNQALSEERAKSVVKYLENLNIKNGRLSSVGYGSKFPVSKNNTEKNRKLNRRITFKVIGSDYKKKLDENK